MRTLGFIGAGNMAAAIIGGVINSAGAGVGGGAAAGEKDAIAEDFAKSAAARIIVSDYSAERLAFFAEKYGVVTESENTEVARRAGLLFLAVKPDAYENVISEIRDCVASDTVVVILAAGLSIADVRKMFGGAGVKLVKVMPNTPAMVNQGMTALCAGENVTSDEFEAVAEIFRAIGEVEELPEARFDAFTAVAGSSPAYVYTFIEALADAGVKHGLTRAQAVKAAAQATLGAAAMVLENGAHTGVLRDAVCSPGGTTIAAVAALEREGFRHAVISAADACVVRYNGLG